MAGSGSDLGGQFVQQRLVGGAVDLAAEQLLGASDRKRGHLVPQLFLGAVGGSGNLGLGQRLLARRLGNRLGPGLVDDLVGAGVGLLDDLVGLGAGFAQGLGDLLLGLGQILLAAVGEIGRASCRERVE